MHVSGVTENALQRVNPADRTFLNVRFGLRSIVTIPSTAFRHSYTNWGAQCPAAPFFGRVALVFVGVHHYHYDQME